MKKFIQQHPVATYLVLAFGWTWLVVAFMYLSGYSADVLNPSPVFILCGILSNLSPSLAAVLVVHMLRDTGYPRLTAGLKVRSRIPWYLLALLIVPIVTASTLLYSHYAIRPYTVAVVLPMLVMGIVWPVFSATGEEFGWRGFLLPRLIKRFGMLKAALLLGVIWECWHLPMHYMAYKDYGSWMIPAFLVVGFLNLTLQTLIMTMIYVKNKGNLKLMLCYHYTITASAILTGALVKTSVSPSGTVLESLFSCALFAVIAAVIYRKNKAFFAPDKAQTAG